MVQHLKHAFFLKPTPKGDTLMIMIHTLVAGTGTDMVVSWAIALILLSSAALFVVRRPR